MVLHHCLGQVCCGEKRTKDRGFLSAWVMGNVAGEKGFRLGLNGQSKTKLWYAYRFGRGGVFRLESPHRSGDERAKHVVRHVKQLNGAIQVVFK